MSGRDKIAKWAPWQDYFHRVDKCITAFIQNLGMGRYDSAQLMAELWHDQLPYQDYEKLNKRYKNHLAAIDSSGGESPGYLVDDNPEAEVRYHLKEIHKILQKMMRYEGMHYQTKKLPSEEWDEDEFIGGSDL